MLTHLLFQKSSHPDAPQKNMLVPLETKLKKAGAIKEVFYPEWLANMVVVRKKMGKW